VGRESLGREPEMTNYAQGMNRPPYCDTLDYIFISRHFEVVSTVPLPSREASSLMPNETEPSDHLLIGAQLRIAGSEQDPGTE
jgi:mRNA deadenylase 3'-5' endonuclease subunit Ccr4